ncbi:helix-turn-helix domain-containing protein [Candidatus Woesearchaeota archaeon]|nr:helix-turn-helix domain-containing protein [Candidatus Woesearchaeota archaeon]MBL7050910.1 helix-turn-helix domain-containing protein [Candidatus Woesearchaeota archaeon]
MENYIYQLCVGWIMHDENLLGNLFDTKSLKILRLFLDDKDEEFYLREISKDVDVPVATTFRIVKRLVELKVVEQVMIKKFKLYKLADNDNTLFLEGILKEKKRALEEFVNSAKNMDFIDEIILHGKETEKRASVLLIGENIDAGGVKRLCAEIKEKHNFIVSILSLGRDQFEQMKGMELFPKVKKSLYRR